MRPYDILRPETTHEPEYYAVKLQAAGRLRLSVLPFPVVRVCGYQAGLAKCGGGFMVRLEWLLLD